MRACRCCGRLEATCWEGSITHPKGRECDHGVSLCSEPTARCHGANRRWEPPSARAGWSPADPGPLGLAAFALTTFVLSMFNAGLVSQAGEPVVLGVALAYGGIAQVLAGMWEFRTGNTFGAVAFTSFGAFWLSFWAFVTFFAARYPGRRTSATAVGLYLIAWGIFTLYMFVASLRTTAAIALVFVLLAIDLLPARDRQRRRIRRLWSKIGGWLRARHGGGRLVCVFRGGHQLDLRARRCCRSDRWARLRRGTERDRWQTGSD